MTTLANVAKPIPWNANAGQVAPEWRALWRSLVYASLPGGWTNDIVSNNYIRYLSGSGETVTDRGFAFESTDSTNHGAWSPFSRSLRRIAYQCSIVLLLDQDTMADNAHMFCIPYRNDATWTVPFIALGFVRDSTTTEGRIFSASGADAANRDVIDSTTGFWETGTGWHVYGVSRGPTVGATEFYKDGKLHSTGTQVEGGANNIDWSNQANINLLQRSNLTVGAGVDGRIAMATVFDRRLTAREQLALATRPFDMFTRWSVVPTSVAPPAGGDIPSLVMPPMRVY